jgi:four helix bundle protein
MGRLRQELIDRVDEFAIRVIDVAEELGRRRAAWRVVDQLVGSGTAIGANLAEADEAMSNPDFFKCVGISLKESSETGYWLRIIAKKGWIKPARLASLASESDQIKRILGAMLSSKRSRS